ncbi:DEAD/DEAH box helicase [Solimonas sp. SE-A11]|uniref:DEAD/DEAH box helicase n=1 Tax=Solimonas sp. SE-A11 TaxID=3054954 RepID=UPI00259C6C08|nr:DEAD/DEAH box helicase [Solimonas sp. SE-A11]MDM4769074.1 DEAD/DEAH box helicase [Solimonas sp. SE-A11]
MFVEKGLDALERKEVRVLVWGLVDCALSESEVDEALNAVLSDPVNQPLLMAADCSISTAGDLRARLLSLALLMEVPSNVLPRRFRTRMAEGVRLFARLRQLFPGRHQGRDGWIGAPTLVADYRLLWRPRRYPKRNLSVSAAMEKIGRVVQTPEQMAAIEHWFGKAKSNWQPARFQIDATARILSGLEQQSPRGTLVSAGTGSGKTLSFYLPALSWLAVQKKTHPRSRGVRILALYPRNELLKDQLGEVFDQARKFDDYLGRSGVEAISVGVFFGGTPRTLRSAVRDWKSPRGVCPFFRCPQCDREMRLLGEDREALACVGCNEIVESSQLRFTRDSMQSEPPDVLFTTVEMLNQHLSNSEARHLFGVGPRAAFVPPLMLLDEVHVYSGTYGAQVAHLLRRWSHLTRRRTSFVGLSATIAEGAEYMLALRGDPVSQASLLSTSIQALMLSSRLADRRQDFHRDERPFAGWRVFAFTDQLDATNRLFYDLRDAEGFTQGGFPATNKHPNGGLAHMRAPLGSRRRYEGGQDWRIVSAVGHDFSARHSVNRTTAYDAGVDHNAQIIIATAALEVGYDDPAVGVVLQHKAPRDMAQFLQRKGRAGRTRHMRPWTVMVLSDYGRDRLAYQAYEQFFDPELPSRELPLANRYIRRMQAVYALIDYLGVKTQIGEPRGSVWRDLTGKGSPVFDGWDKNVRGSIERLAREAQFPLRPEEWKSLSKRARALAPAQLAPSHKDRWEASSRVSTYLRRIYLLKLLDSMLSGAEETEAFIDFVAASLCLSREEMLPLLWDHPRPLLLGVVPTASRRLRTNWKSHGQVGADQLAKHPLPEFAPATLFSDLSLPEVGLLEPGKSETFRYLPVLQALSEFAPGKVSRRLDIPYWLGPSQERLASMLDNPQVEEVVDIDDWFMLEPQLPFHFLENGSVQSCRTYRPIHMKLSATPQRAAGNRPGVLDKSNARLCWHSQIFGEQPGAVFRAPGEKVGIAQLVDSVAVHTHASQSPATVRRYAIGSSAELKIHRGQIRSEHSAAWRFQHQGSPCGIGFEIEVDALCFRLRLPTSPGGDLRDADPVVQRAARTARFAWEAQHGKALRPVEENAFLRAWMAQIIQVAAVKIAEERQCRLDEAFDAIQKGGEAECLSDVLTTIFQSPETAESWDGDDDAPADEETEPRLRKHLTERLGRAEILTALRDLAAKTLIGPFDADWDEWASRATVHTLGAALLEAIQQACPQINSEDLIVDVDPGPLDGGARRDGLELWISEVNPGGNGLIEQIVAALATDVAQFYRRIEAALGPSEFEVIDAQLTAFQRWIGGQSRDGEVEAVVQSVRTAQSSQEAKEALSTLRKRLIERGQAVFHGYVAALSSRMLRNGTPFALDELMAELLQRWDAIEERLGVEVDARLICALFSTDPRIDQAFQAAGFELPEVNREPWRFSVLGSVVWARGHALRAHALPLATRFSDTPAVTERLLLQGVLTPAEPAILGSDADWLTQLHTRLIERGRATLSVDPGSDALNAAMAAIVTVPVQLEYLNVYSKLVSTIRSEGRIHLLLELEAAI